MLQGAIAFTLWTWSEVIFVPRRFRLRACRGILPRVELLIFLVWTFHGFFFFAHTLGRRLAGWEVGWGRGLEGGWGAGAASRGDGGGSLSSLSGALVPRSYRLLCRGYENSYEIFLELYSSEQVSAGVFAPSTYRSETLVFSPCSLTLLQQFLLLYYFLIITDHFYILIFF